jgi:imidazolonepropionase-like amidohydrolase
VPDSVVVLRGGRIDCAGSQSACAVPDGILRDDVRGAWITPGLIDAHVHFSQTGWADGRPDSLDVRANHPYEEVEAGLRSHPERFFRTDLCAGVTGVFDVGGYAWTLRLPGLAESDTRAPHVSAAGPLLSTLDHWLNLPAERQFIHLKDAETAKTGVSYLASQGSQAVKVWYIVNKDLPIEASEPAVHAAGAEAAKRNLPLIVHATGLAEAKAALRSGAKMLVHSVDDAPVDAEFLSLAKKNGTIYCPTLTVISGYLRMYEAALSKRVPDTDDPNRCLDAATLSRVRETASLSGGVDAARMQRMRDRVARMERFMGDNLLAVQKAGIPIAMGTDAGNPLTLHGTSVYGEMEAMQKAGMTPGDVLAASTRGGSFAMRREKDIGTVEKGKIADLLVVGADPTKDIANMRKVKSVVRGGVLRSVEEMSAVIAAGK